ncbi:MAG: hypothetical protein A2033_09115 [Bacteroidetes bacterium GWA2_31_9]|nr:MAG: hypothetical protein A2033_09115 [Bacteroidetes bacterium GWA2_31_9]
MGGRLANIFQGIGTTLIGFIIAFIFWLIIYIYHSDLNECTLSISIFCWFVLIGFTYLNYDMNKKVLGVNQNAILIEFIFNKWEKNNSQIIELHFPL